jgi:hypothetical protein
MKTKREKTESKIILSIQDFDYVPGWDYVKVGRPVKTTLWQFCADDDDGDVRALKPGETVRLGGGAQPVVEVKRLVRAR